MKIFGRTDIGSVRSSNQDAYLSGYLPDGAVWSAVCDGMGGANGGNIASLTAVDVIAAGFESATLTPDMDTAVAAHLMGRQQVRRLPVVENGKLYKDRVPHTVRERIEEEIGGSMFSDLRREGNEKG